MTWPNVVMLQFFPPWDLCSRTRWFASNIILAVFCLTGSPRVSSATDITIHLPHAAPVSRASVIYLCDSGGAQIGVPSNSFLVEYIEGGGNSLAIVPIGGSALIFSNVNSASGSRYRAQQYTWWEAKGVATLYSDSLTGKLQFSCHRVPLK